MERDSQQQGSALPDSSSINDGHGSRLNLRGPLHRDQPSNTRAASSSHRSVEHPIPSTQQHVSTPTRSMNHGQQPNPRNNLDPTGMFRNRGRHVVARQYGGQKMSLKNISQHGHGGVNGGSGGQRVSSPQLLSHHTTDVVANQMDDAQLEQTVHQPAETCIGEIIATRSDEQIDAQTDPAPTQFINNSSPECAGPPDDVSVKDGDPLNEESAEPDGNVQIETSLSQDSNDSAPSAIGSTISQMGSVADYDDDDNHETKSGPYSSVYNKMHKVNEARWLEVKRRMMQDVQEVDDDDFDEGAIEAETENVVGGDTDNNTGSIYNAKLPHALSNDSLQSMPDYQQQGKNDAVNISMECNIDSDTSLLDDSRPLFCDDHSEVMEEGDATTTRSNVVKVADFSSMNGNYDNNYVHDEDDNNNDLSSPATYQPSAASADEEQESPLRAAFRRKAQDVSNSLSPFSSSFLSAPTVESLKRITPRFQVVGDAPTAAVPNANTSNTPSSTNERAITTNSLLPLPLQLARKCFSFDDTTLDDDNFVAMPYQPQLDTVGERGGQHPQQSFLPPPQPQSTKYYGLSAVASFPSDYDNSLTARNNATKMSPATLASKSGILRPKWNTEPESPFRIIRHSQTWNHTQQHSNLVGRETARQQTSSFDPWSSYKGQVYPLSNTNGRVEPFPLYGEDKRGEDDENKEQTVSDILTLCWIGMTLSNLTYLLMLLQNIQTERDDAIGLLACIVEQSLNFVRKEPIGEDSEPKSADSIDSILCETCQAMRGSNNPSQIQSCLNCESCMDKMQQLVSSIKDISASHVDQLGDAHSSPSNHHVRSIAIDTLMQSYKYSVEMKRASLSAHKWLDSLGRAKHVALDATNDKSDQSLDGVAHKARLHAAEFTISKQQKEIHRLNEEVVHYRAEVGRLRNTSLSKQIRGVSSTANRSILSDSSSEDSLDAIIQKGRSLVLGSPRAVIKLSESRDESFALFERKMESDMNLEARKEVLLLKAALEKANRKIASLERLNTVSEKKEPFPSEIEPITTSVDDLETELFLKIADEIEESMSALLSEETEGARESEGMTNPTIQLGDPALEEELEKYRAALIETLQIDASHNKIHSTNSMSMDDANLAQDVSKSHSSELASEQRMVNVRMIDGENFVTEWENVSALPPPPDHGLRSPIVDAILKRWTDDEGTRVALTNWVEGILNGADPESILPLKIAGLDHQIKDGFLMHVLPLLLRRKDVHVQVTSRATRTTQYDIAVAVSPSADSNHDNDKHDASTQQHQTVGESKHHLMAFRATRSGSSMKESVYTPQVIEGYPTASSYLSSIGRKVPSLVRSGSNAGSISTAVTSPISNRTPTKVRPFFNAQLHGVNRHTPHHLNSSNASFPRNDNAFPIMSVASPALGDDLSVGSSVNDDDGSKQSFQSSRQASIMNSLGDAFGGFLSRTKPPKPSSPANDSPPVFLTPHFVSTPKASQHDEEHPYHRVVSAPAGKIGMTFVEYRGHCMVSHVAEDSPLSGWVFPSDILIAINDVQVSGLKTRDIVKLLTAKKGQRRDLRMISSHDMNELIKPGGI